MRSDWAGEFVAATKEYLENAGPRRVVIILDELDKLLQPAEALMVVNEIKDLMHADGVHFIVSISEDALIDFDLRGLPLRDAFDSVFDEVFHLHSLSSRGAIQLLESRVAVFPRPLALFCFAWSGGNARDLIRTARSCATTPHQSRASLSSIVEHVVWSDARDAAQSFTRRAGLMGLLSRHGQLKLGETLGSSAPDRCRLLCTLFGAMQIALPSDPDVQSFQTYLTYAVELVDEFSDTAELANWLRDDDDGALERACTELARRRQDLHIAWRYRRDGAMGPPTPTPM